MFQTIKYRGYFLHITNGGTEPGVGVKVQSPEVGGGIVYQCKTLGVAKRWVLKHERTKLAERKAAATPDYSSVEFWDAAPEYDTRAFWVLALKQPGTDDAHGRNLLIIGWGVAGAIRCTREYAEFRLRACRNGHTRRAVIVSAACGVNDGGIH